MLGLENTGKNWQKANLQHVLLCLSICKFFPQPSMEKNALVKIETFVNNR